MAPLHMSHVQLTLMHRMLRSCLTHMHSCRMFVYALPTPCKRGLCTGVPRSSTYPHVWRTRIHRNAPCTPFPPVRTCAPASFSLALPQASTHGSPSQVILLIRRLHLRKCLPFVRALLYIFRHPRSGAHVYFASDTLSVLMHHTSPGTNMSFLVLICLQVLTRHFTRVICL